MFEGVVSKYDQRFFKFLPKNNPNEAFSFPEDTSLLCY